MLDLNKLCGMNGKTAIVTGAASGIGAGIARFFADAGVSVVIADINEELARKVEKEINDAGGHAEFMRCDVTKEADCKAVADAVAKELPALFCDLRFWELFPDTLPTLTALKDEGHTLVLLTNHIPEARRIFEHLGVLPLFDRAIISSEQDVEKPDPRIWDLALDGFERDGAVMIGDNYSTDIKGALACGLQAILVRKPNDADYPLYSPTLEGIVPVLRQL